MTATAKTLALDTRGLALGLWPERKADGIDEARLTPSRRRHVAVMLEAGWLDRVGGRLRLNDVGRQAIDGLLPEMFDSTMTGTRARRGSKTRSHEQ